ncbi:MAG: DUF4367 domain-containing protein [Bellilinea sp.]
MREKQIQSFLKNLAEQKAPGREINLWPAIESQLQTSDRTNPKGTIMDARQKRIPRLAAAVTLAVILIAVIFFLTPQGQAMAQSFLRFFTRAESNQLPPVTAQETPPLSIGTPTEDPASILDANPEIAEVRQATGFTVYEPSWIPGNLAFAGASLEEEGKIVRIFYRYVETNGLVFRQELIPLSDDCELCGVVGAEAEIKTVSIAGTDGEYVEGVWKFTDQGPVWESDPYLQTMRWQANGMAFELLYMGPPDSLSMEDMISIAESIK